MAIDRFDPAANDARYGLDYAAYLVCRERPTSIHIACSQRDVAEAAIRRLPLSITASVPQAETAEWISGRLARRVTAGTGEGVDAIVVPFAAEEWAAIPAAPFVAVVDRNAHSYKSLLAPGQLPLTASNVLAWVRSRWTVTERVGLMGPDFIALWALAEWVGHKRSDWHFRLRDSAMQRIFCRGPIWRFGYVVIVAGRRS